MVTELIGRGVRVVIVVSDRIVDESVGTIVDEAAVLKVVLEETVIMCWCSSSVWNRALLLGCELIKKST